MDVWLLNLFNLTGLVEGAETANLVFESPIWLWLIVFWPLFWWLSSRFTANNDLSDIAARRQLQVRHALIHKVQHIKPIKQITVFSFGAIIFNLLRGLAISLIAIALV